MDLVDCVLTRKVTRAYHSIPVPKELLAKILDEARNCASAENTQPWEFAVFGGQVIEEMRRANQERFLAGINPTPEIPYESSMWPEHYLPRMRGCGKPSLLSVLGIDLEDQEARRQLWIQGLGFWGAPNGIVIYIDRGLPTLSIIDVGGILQTILLLAHNYGLGCCPQQQIVFHPDIVRQFLNIPPAKLIVMGVAIGYPDQDAIINTYKIGRLPLEEMVTWHGI